MNRIFFAVLLAVAAAAAGFLGGRYASDGDMPPSSASQDAEEPEILYWVAPMDPNFRRDEPGKSPMGMDLVPVYADSAGGQPGVVNIDPTIVSNLGVRTAPAQSGVLPRRIETVGYISYDEDTLHHVHTRVDGWIERLAPKTTGDPVVAGEVLFELYSPTLVNAQQEFVAALRSGNASLISASRERLVSLGISDDEIAEIERDRKVRQRVRVEAAKDGVVAMLGVREGIYVTPSTDIMSIAELDRVWVTAEVFERQSAWVEPGQHAMVEVDYLPARLWHGTVDYVYPELDPETRTLRVRLRFDNQTFELKPNMFARVSILGRDTGEVVHVPREALIRGGSVDRVVIALGDGRFRAQPVEVGIESGDRVAILDGIEAGDSVVVSGQFLIDSESNIESAFSRFEDPGVDDGSTDGTGSDNIDGAAMDHEGMDHEAMDHEAMDHEGMDHENMDHDMGGDDDRADASSMNDMDHSQHRPDAPR